MEKIQNIFGEGNLYREEDLKGKIYVTSAACMSVWSDFLSWANAHPNRISKEIETADTIVVLGCQVTDLSILNDIEVAFRLHKQTGKEIYMGGCLAQRLDIELPDYIRRLDVVRTEMQPLYQRDFVHYEKPYWVQDFEETEDTLAQGNLFRNFYPLKIGAGCHGKCKYCTIRHTRGNNYETVPSKQIEEFLSFENVVLISDSPTVNQIKEWCRIATQYQKEISIRNIEPQTLVMCKDEVENLSKLGLLKILHCPVQSFDEEVLKIMNRSVAYTKEAVEIMQRIRKNGTLIATNIIIDYQNNGIEYSNYEKEKLDEMFDYYSWNPYFDGNWDIEKAKMRFKKYITNRG